MGLGPPWGAPLPPEVLKIKCFLSASCRRSCTHAAAWPATPSVPDPSGDGLAPGPAGTHKTGGWLVPQWVCWRLGAWVGWRKGPAGTSSSSTSAKSCPGGGTSPGTSTGWGHPAGEQLGREGPGGHQAEHEQRRPRVSWAASGGAWPAGRGRGSATERPGAVQPGDETARGDLIHVHRYLQGGCREDRARLFPVVSRGHGPTLEHRRVPLNIRKRFSLGGCPSPGTGCPGRWWSLHPWRCSPPSGHGPGPPAEGGLHQTEPRGASSLSSLLLSLPQH